MLLMGMDDQLTLMQIGQLFEQLRHTTRAGEVAGRGPGMDVLHGPRTTNRTTTLFRIGSGPVSWISVDTGYWFFWGLWFSSSWWDGGVPHTIMLFLLPHMLSAFPGLCSYLGGLMLSSSHTNRLAMARMLHTTCWLLGGPCSSVTKSQFVERIQYPTRLGFRTSGQMILRIWDWI